MNRTKSNLVPMVLAVLVMLAGRATAGGPEEPGFGDLSRTASLLGVPASPGGGPLPAGVFRGTSAAPLPGLTFEKRFAGGGGEVRLPPLPFAVARFSTRRSSGSGFVLTYGDNPPPLSWIVDEITPDGTGNWRGRTFVQIPHLGRFPLMTFALARSASI